MAKNRIKELWGNAIALTEAWHEFAPPLLRDELANLPTGLQELEVQMNHASGISKIINAGLAGLNAKQKRSAKIGQLRENLLDELFNSKLIALGYRQAPSESRGPVQIAAIFFECATIEWDTNFAEFNGKTYRLIRIISPRDISDKQKLKTGRPSSANVINSAIANIMKTNSQFCHQNRAISCQQIRKIIDQPIISGNGLSDNNLRKYITAICGCRQIAL